MNDLLEERHAPAESGGYCSFCGEWANSAYDPKASYNHWEQWFVVGMRSCKKCFESAHLDLSSRLSAYRKIWEAKILENPAARK